MNIKKVLTTVIALLFISAASCFAGEIDVTKDWETSDIIVSGSIGDNFKNRYLMLYCLKDGTDISDIEAETDEQQKTDKIGAVQFTETDENGDYRFPAFKVNGESGDYRFYVTVFRSDKIFSSEAVHIAEHDSVIAFVNAMQNRTGTEILDLINDELKTNNLGLIVPLFKNLNNKGKEAACNALAEREYEGITDIMTEINRASVKAGIEYADNASALDMLLYPQDYSDLSEWADIIAEQNDIENYMEHSVLKAIEKTEKSARIKIFSEVLSINSSETLTEKISVSLINYELSSCSGYGDITGIISSHKEDALKELDFDTYNNSKYKNSLNKELLKKSFTSCRALIDYIEAYLKNAESSASPGYNTPSGGGGGGTGTGKNGGASINSTFIGGISQAKPKDEDKEEQPMIFSDMSGYEWAEEAVLYLAGKGIVAGRGNNSFEPQDNVTKEEFVKMVVTAFPIEIPQSESGFDDVIHGAWYEKYIAAAVKAGIVNGISDTEFGTGTFITRQDMAVIAARAAGASAQNADTAFADDGDIAEYAKASVGWMLSKGYLNGYEDGSFRPKNFCTRAEAAKIIYGLIN